MTSSGSGTIPDNVRSRWTESLFSTAPADRDAAESSVRDMYVAAELQAPRMIAWVDSPAAGCWAVLMLLAKRQPLYGRMVEGLQKSRPARELLEGVREKLCSTAKMASWEDLAGGAGGPLLGQGANPKQSFQGPQLLSRVALWGDPTRAMGSFHQDHLFLSHASLFTLFSRSVYCGAEFMLKSSVSQSYNFYWMAMDEHAASQGKAAAPFLTAAWRVAKAAGPWWAFEGLAVLADHPMELHRNARGLPENGDGAAIVWRDGTRIFAWNGQSLPEKWILRPE